MSQEPIEEIIDKVLQVYSNSKVGELLDPYSSSVVDKLLGPNSSENRKELIRFYTQKLIEAENGNESSKQAVDKINRLMNFIFDRNNISAIFNYYSSNIFILYDIFEKEFFQFCKDNNVEEWSKESFSRIEEMVKAFAKYMNSLTIFSKFLELEKRANSKGKFFGNDVKNRFLSSGVLTKRFLEVNNLYDFNQMRLTIELENYFLNYTAGVLEKNDIDGVWDDDIVNLVLQLRNTKRISEKNLQNPALKKLDSAVESFCKSNFSKERLAELRAKLGMLIGKYAIQKFDDPSEQIEFEEAYKLLYVYELVSGKQSEVTPYSNYYDLFLFRQLDSFEDRKIRKITNINVERLIMRATQSTIIKEMQKELSEREEKIDSPLITIIDNDYMYHEGAATANNMCDAIEVSNGIPYDNFWSRNLSLILYHEMDHYGHYKKGRIGAIDSFDEYKVFKNLFAEAKNISINTGNYENQYSEIQANCSGFLATIQALRMFPAGENDSEVQSKINDKIDEIKKMLERVKNNTLRIQDKVSKRWETDNEIIVYDKVFKDISSKDRPPIFDFEYRDDGTPKELFEIIMDQQRELEIPELHPDCSPKSPTKRAKIRFQIMMERAMVTHQEKMCYLIIRDYIQQHKEQFKDDELFKMVFPSGDEFSTFDFDKLITNALKDGKKVGFQNALFLVRLQAMAERVHIKEGFGESVFSFFEYAMGLNKPKQKPGDKLGTELFFGQDG